MPSTKGLEQGARLVEQITVRIYQITIRVDKDRRQPALAKAEVRTDPCVARGDHRDAAAAHLPPDEPGDAIDSFGVERETADRHSWVCRRQDSSNCSYSDRYHPSLGRLGKWDG